MGHHKHTEGDVCGYCMVESVDRITGGNAAAAGVTRAVAGCYEAWQAKRAASPAAIDLVYAAAGVVGGEPIAAERYDELAKKTAAMLDAGDGQLFDLVDISLMLHHELAGKPSQGARIPAGDPTPILDESHAERHARLSVLVRGAVDAVFVRLARDLKLESGDWAPDQEVELDGHCLAIARLVADWIDWNTADLESDPDALEKKGF